MTPIPKKLFPFLRWAYKGQKVWMYLLLTCATLAGFYLIINTTALRNIIDNLPLAQSSKSIQPLLWPFIILITAHQAHMLLWRAILFAHSRMAPRVKERIVKNILEYALHHSPGFYQDHMTGSIASKVTTLTACVETMGFVPLAFSWRAAVQLMSTLCIIFCIDPMLAFTLFFWSTCFFTVSYYYYKKIRQRSKTYAQKLSSVTEHIVDSIANVTSVQAFGQIKREVHQIRAFTYPMRHAFKTRIKTVLIAYTLQGLCLSALLGFTTFSLIQSFIQESITLGHFVLVETAILVICEAVWMLLHELSHTQDLAGQCQAALDTILQPHSITSPPEPPKAPALLKGSIHFQNVSFTYPNQSTKLFDNLSLTIPKGQKVGLVGESGSGKSSFIQLIIRAFDVDSGSIIIDNQNIQSLPQTFLYKHISMTPQSAMLFHRSVRENICYGNPAVTEHAMIQAAQATQAHTFIQSMPEAYNTVVGEHGVKLSGGQRQRIALTRAFLKTAPIMIFDEATSQIDPIIERAIQESVDQHTKDKTVIIAAHRLSTLKNVERILVFEKGSITGDDTHENLLKHHSYYQMLWHHYQA